MNIRPKLILAELLFSLALFSAVFFAITTFVGSIRFEDLKIKVAGLKGTAASVRYSALEMLTSTDPTSFLTQEHKLLRDEMSREFEDILSDSSFRRLPVDVRDYFSVVIDSWNLTTRSFVIEDIADLLDTRATDPDRPVSLFTKMALLRQSGETASIDLELTENAVAQISLAERSFSEFSLLLNRVLADVLASAEDFRIRQFTLILVIPLIVLALVLSGILIFSNGLSRRLKILDRSLSAVAGGDFSIRVDMKSRDEFGSLATSINAFTRTLGAKLESFRLIMHEIGQTLGQGIDAAQVEATLLRLAIRDTAADGGALYRVGGESGELVLSTMEGRFRPPFEVFDLPDAPTIEDMEAILRSRIIRPGITILGESATSGKPEMIRDVENTGGLTWNRDADDPLYLSSVIVVPLQVGSTVFGIIVITSTRKGLLFSDLDFANMQSFGELAAITLDNIYKYSDLLEAGQLNRELGIAEEIQQDLLPKRLPRLPGSEVAYLSRSIKGLNGDYFDVYPLGDGRTLLTICEVAGRGVPAGLVMVMIRTVLHLISSPEKDARSIMTELNGAMTQRIAIDSYASVGILIVDENGNFTFSSAAHYPLMLLRSDSGEAEEIQTAGIPVGIDENAEYSQQKGQLKPGDLLVFHTDGVPESRNRDGNLFGVKSLIEIVREKAVNAPEQIIEDLRRELEYFERGTDQKDDQTVIVLKYRGRNAA